MTIPEHLFRSWLGRNWTPDVLELGTLRWREDDPTHHRDWAPEGARYVMSDVEAGTDVDVVADAHHLAAALAPRSFDAVIACSVWEHLQRPWKAAQSVADIMRPGGRCYIQTHQSFPLHGYPHDYFRFSADAMRTIFEDAGLETMEVAYQHRAKITPPDEITVWDPTAPVYLNVVYLGRKP